jgi:tellurite resistance protein TehA-like permease
MLRGEDGERENGVVDADRTSTAGGGLPPDLPGTGPIGRWVATLDPVWFAWVMASGIISIGTELLGYHRLSEIALWVTEAAFVVLIVAYGTRAIAFREQFQGSLRDPRKAMAFFTVVAGSNVLGVRLVMAGHPLVGLALGAGAVLVWLALTYGLPAYVITGARHPVLGDINGTWLVWVVATQSVAVIAAALAPVAPWSPFRRALPTVAVTFWSIGVTLYLVLIVVVLLRLLLVEITPGEMGGAYWITMGATAISVRAAAGILVVQNQPGDTLVHQMRPLLVDLSVVLWAFGTWWIPLLVLLGLWRYLLRRYPLSFEPGLWSVVFPLGMYTVASVSLGRAANLGFMVTLARGWLWVGVAAWAAVLVLMLVSLGQALRRGSARGASLVD